MKANDQLLEGFLEVMEPVRVKDTLRRYRRILSLFHHQVKTLSEVQASEIMTFIQNPKHGRQTQIQSFAVLKHYFEWLILEEQILFSPMRNLNYPKSERQLPKRIMSLGETQRLLETMPLNESCPATYRDRLMMELLYACSLRRGEIVALELSDFDADLQSLKIKAGKTKRGRLLPIGDRVSRLLKVYIERVRPNVTHKALFVADKGGRVHADWVTRTVRVCRQKSQIRTKATSHSFRKSSATHMLRNGAGLPSVQALLGHEHIESTEIYTKVYPQDLFRIHRAHHPREKQKNPVLPELETPTLLFRRK